MALESGSRHRSSREQPASEMRLPGAHANRPPDALLHAPPSNSPPPIVPVALSAEPPSSPMPAPAVADNTTAPASTTIQRLEREKRQLLRQIEQLSGSARSIASELDSQRLAGEIARQATALVGADCSLLWLMRDHVLRLHARCQSGTIDLFAADPSDGPPPTRLTTWVARRRQFKVLNHPLELAEFQLSNVPGIGCIRNALAVPVLSHQNDVLGVIELYNRRMPGPFTEADRRAAVCLAHQASTGIDRARLFDRMHEWTHSLEMLLSFNAAVNQHLSPAELVRRLVENAIRFLESSGGMAGLAVPTEEGQIVFTSDGYFQDHGWFDHQRQWASGEGTPGTVLKSEFPYFANQYDSDPLADAELAVRFRVARAVCVPIKNARDEVLGFFELHRRAAAPPFTWQDAALLESLGNTAAVAIENAQLLASLERQNRRIQTLSAANVMRLEKERRHIARELHDETGQMLIGMNLSLQLLSRLIPPHLREAHEQLRHLRQSVRQSAVQLKELAKRLRPPTLDEIGLVAALRQLVSEMQDRSTTTVHVDCADSLEPLPPDLETALYRIAQEAITNIMKHADATTIWLQLRADHQRLLFRIEDDGRGFDIRTAEKGLGLLGMRERVDMLGGRIEIASQRGRGTIVTAVFPLSTARADIALPTAGRRESSAAQTPRSSRWPDRFPAPSAQPTASAHSRPTASEP